MMMNVRAGAKQAQPAAQHPPPMLFMPMAQSLCVQPESGYSKYTISQGTMDHGRQAALLMLTGLAVHPDFLSANRAQLTRQQLDLPEQSGVPSLLTLGGPRNYEGPARMKPPILPRPSNLGPRADCWLIAVLLHWCGAW